MRDPTNRDRLIVKLFYTACCLVTDLLALILALVPRDRGDWDPGAGGVLGICAVSLIVLLAIWGPHRRRRDPAARRRPLDALRWAFNLLAALAATLLLWLLLAQAIDLSFRQGDPYRRWAWGISLAGVVLIVLVSWGAATAGLASNAELPPAEDATAEA